MAQNNPTMSLVLHSSDQLFLVDNFSRLNNDDEHWRGELKDIDIPLQDHKLTSVLHCNGLLCLSYIEVDGVLAYNKFCIYNIFTLAEWTALPPQPMIKEYKVAYGFGFHPKTKEYKVVRIAEQECVVDGCEISVNQSVEVCTVGTSEWRAIENNKFLLRMQPCKALVNGALHWLGQDKQSGSKFIVSFDLLNEEFCRIPSPTCRLDGYESYLQALGGCLSVVDYDEKHKIDIWLMKNYGMKESWTKEFTIDLQIPLYGFIRPLCLVEHGKILIQYEKQALFAYDLESKRVSKIKLGNLPHSFQAVPIC